MHRDSVFHISAPDEPSVSDAAISEALRARFRRRVSRILDGRRRAQPSVVRVSVRTPTIDPLRWLGMQEEGFRFFWHSRGADEQIACAGIAEEVTGGNAIDRVRRRLATYADEGLDVRYFGGTRFSTSGEIGDEWKPFGEARFVLPRFEMRADGDEVSITLNILTRTDAPAEIYDAIEDLRFPGDGSPPPIPTPTDRRDTPERNEWDQAVADVLQEIDSGRFQKVVLARRSRLEFAEAVDPFALLELLRHATPSSFHFLAQPRKGIAFLGAAPERLFKLDGRSLKSEAVAGTRPRSDDAIADRELHDALHDSEKDRREHQMVTDGIVAALGDIANEVATDETSVMAFSSKWHLQTPISARLEDDVTSADVLRALHPTPAVGGHPTDAALEHISRAETFDRGWYAGPVGWLGTDGAELAVALRCGLVTKQDGRSRLDLYAGAGIVPGSEPEAEWAEIEDKLVDFVRVLGLEA